MMAQLCRPTEVTLLYHHLERHAAESGDGGYVFLVPSKLDELLFSYNIDDWTKPSTARGFQRVWVEKSYDGAVRAHSVLTGNHLAPHRATFAIGVEAAHRGQGLGNALMRAALDWAVGEPGLAWIDAWTFASNEPALCLHMRRGFEEVGRVADVMRIGERSFGEVKMVLDLNVAREGDVPWL